MDPDGQADGQSLWLLQAPAQSAERFSERALSGPPKGRILMFLPHKESDYEGSRYALAVYIIETQELVATIMKSFGSEKKDVDEEGRGKETGTAEHSKHSNVDKVSEGSSPAGKSIGSLGVHDQAGGDLEALQETANLLKPEHEAQKHELEALKNELVALKKKVDHLAANNRQTQRSSSLIDEEINYQTLPWDAYAFFYCCDPKSSPLWIGVTVVILQVSLFSLFLWDLLNSNEIPANVEVAVRATQGISILVSFLIQADVRTGLRTLIRQDGIEVLEAEFVAFSYHRFILANALMCLQGLLGQIVVIVLILMSDNVFDLLLNFTAVVFISELDEVTFLLAATGYAGPRAEKAAKRIKHFKFETVKHTGCFAYFHLLIFAVLLVLAYVAYAIVVTRQTSNTSLCSEISVEFGDTTLSILGTYAGCYTMVGGTGTNARVSYKQVSQPGRNLGVLQYCLTLRAWTFAKEGDDGCNEYLAKSSESRPTSFDVLDSQQDTWLSSNGVPIEYVLMSCASTSSNVCGDYWPSSDIATKPCSKLIMDVDASGFVVGGREFSREFVLLLQEGSTDDFVQAYQHPVYVGTFRDNSGYELIFFTGRRWILCYLPGISVEEITLLFVEDSFLYELPTQSISFVSGTVDSSNDLGTPLGLQWYISRYKDGTSFPAADTSRPSDVVLLCGTCDSTTNQCLYEGECNQDGTCSCKHGASGSLCETKPLGNGDCNTYFNSAMDQYDGGDCCGFTCVGELCGLDAVSYAFGQELESTGTGYSYCKDPSLVPITLVYSNLATSVHSSLVYSIPPFRIVLRCDSSSKDPRPESENEEFPILSVGLPWNQTSKASETIWVEDGAICTLVIDDADNLRMNYEVWDGDVLGNLSKSIILDGWFDGNDDDIILSQFILYKECLKATVRNVLNSPELLYSNSYQDQAVGWMNNDTSSFSDCDRPDLLERYALTALMTAGPTDLKGLGLGTNNNMLHPSWHCGDQWTVVTCREGHVVGLTSRGNIPKQKGFLPTDIGLLTHLGTVDLSPRTLSISYLLTLILRFFESRAFFVAK